MNNYIRKTEKVISMLLQLAKQKLDVENASQFIDTLQMLPISIIDPTAVYFPNICSLVCLIVDRLENTKAVTSDQQHMLKTLEFATIRRQDLQTDDTIQFTKACKDVQEGVDSLSQSSITDKLLIERRKESILGVMTSALRQYKRQWAKQPVELLFRAAASTRVSFEGSQLEALDELTNTMTREQRANTANIGPRTIRTYDSTAHPLRQKNVGVLR